jgi:glyoxylase-like metal-dependent hydrolase (beta-lactamase superfamily II)/rhodanese-related sulfurtransferase
MKVEQIYTSCLAQGSYYIESNGEAAVIDPLREVDAYINMATERGARIKYIFETHFHADFVSGHLTLAEKTGAPIVFGPTANTDFECLVGEDNQKFKIGNITIRLLHTPGHTMESSCYLLMDQNRKQIAIFSGDTLFLGDVGRPDLAQSTNITQEDLAGILFESLRNKIMTLPDEVIVYPGHGAGSSCGKNMSKETVGSIGHEKATNYALRSDMTKQEFVQEVTDGILPPPVYFSENVRLNKQGYAIVNKNIEKANVALSAEDFKEKSLEEGVVILDVRSAENFVKGFIPNSIFIGIDGGFAPWVGTIIKHIETPILLVCEIDRLEEVAIRLSRVGFDNVLGHLKGGVYSWKKDDLATILSISSNEFNSIYQANNQINIVDVRKETEYQTRHIIDAKLAPLSMLEIHGSKFVNDKQNYVHCAGGYRSGIACSLLKRVGINNTINIEGGFDAIKKTTINLSAEDCPSIL